MLIFGAVIVGTDYLRFMRERSKVFPKVERKIEPPCGYTLVEYDSGIDCTGKKIYVKPIADQIQEAREKMK